MELTDSIGAPFRIDGNVRIKLIGEGRARFRLQHTGVYQSAPDPLGWSDVTRMSDARLASPMDAVDADMMVSGFLVDWVNGPTEVCYRRYSAHYLRVIVFDEDDDANELACMKYRIEYEPI